MNILVIFDSVEIRKGADSYTEISNHTFSIKKNYAFVNFKKFQASL